MNRPCRRQMAASTSSAMAASTSPPQQLIASSCTGHTACSARGRSGWLLSCKLLLRCAPNLLWSGPRADQCELDLIGPNLKGAAMVETSWYTPLSKRTSDITTSPTSSSWTSSIACIRAPTPTVGRTAHVAGARHGTLRLREKAGCDKRAKRLNLNMYSTKTPGCHRPPLYKRHWHTINDKRSHKWANT